MRILRLAIGLLLATLVGFGAAAASASEVSRFFVAVEVDSASGVKSFLDAGGDPNARDPRSGETALIIAMREESMNVFKELLRNPRLDLELAAPNGNTALMMAAFKRNKPAVLALLDRGAAVNRKGWSPLHYAAASGATDIARLLLERGAAIDALAPSDLTPLMLAAREGQESAALLLLEAGANAALVNGEGLTAAALAARADKPRIAEAVQAHLAAYPPQR